MTRETAWWSEIAQCRATTKRGKRCQSTARMPIETERGNLYIYLTCAAHSDQENKLQREANLK